MVDVAKQKEYERFARRLAKALNNVPGCPPGRGRAGWLARQPTIKVSHESARKWIEGLGMPDQAHMAALARLCHVNPAWLQADVGPATPAKVDKFFDRLSELWPSLSEDRRREILKFAEFQSQQVQDPFEIAPGTA